MQSLVEAIREHGVILPGGILKVDGLVNHQLLPHITRDMGRQFADYFRPLAPTKVLTIEVSGIAPAIVTAIELGVPMVYARKKRPVTMHEEAFHARSVSRTKGGGADLGVVDLYVSGEYLGPDDQVVVIDDFLASGGTLLALHSIIVQSGAALLGLGCVIEKSFEGGRAKLAHLGVPIHTLANIVRMSEQDGVVVESGR